MLCYERGSHRVSDTFRAPPSGSMRQGRTRGRFSRWMVSRARNCATHSGGDSVEIRVDFVQVTESSTACVVGLDVGGGCGRVRCARVVPLRRQLGTSTAVSSLPLASDARDSQCVLDGLHRRRGALGGRPRLKRSALVIGLARTVANTAMPARVVKIEESNIVRCGALLVPEDADL